MNIFNKIFKDKERLEEFMDWWDGADLEEGDYHKHDCRFATKVLEVDDRSISEFPELSGLNGCVFEQEGTLSYNYGWDSYNDVALYSYEEKQTNQYSDFKSLLRHLNAEDNDMASEYADKYIEKTIKVKTEVVL